MATCATVSAGGAGWRPVAGQTGCDRNAEGKCSRQGWHRRLYVGERFHAREAGAEDVSAADGTGGILEALLIAVVEVTEFFVFEGG